jgi:hypothetical protein
MSLPAYCPIARSCYSGFIARQVVRMAYLGGVWGEANYLLAVEFFDMHKDII